ncbi:SHOCT domain-containing protein [Candidatus Villigracilis saccharophilus]|uniref:SHOCT domain-containing protein n=1 Tax=Candidatus Villigracilis saccharophilus TaxID=3140684 RepID=UPI003135372D|nr:SHOCT domain-containing protein [Anaerolineales bacterium]
MSLEEKIIENARRYESDGKKQVHSATGKNETWYKSIHLHFEGKIAPLMKEAGEHFIEYHPVKFSFGESTGYKQGLSSGKLYRHTYGTYGSGYICFSDQNIYINALDALTKEYPLYPKGTQGFLDTILSGLQGEMNDRNPCVGDKIWSIDYPSINGAQITPLDGEYKEILLLMTTTVDWQIHEHFKETLPEMLETIKLGRAGKLTAIWSKPNAASLLKSLTELKNAGIISEADFEKKKQQL